MQMKRSTIQSCHLSGPLNRRHTLGHYQVPGKWEKRWRMDLHFDALLARSHQVHGLHQNLVKIQVLIPGTWRYSWDFGSIRCQQASNDFLKIGQGPGIGFYHVWTSKFPDDKNSYHNWRDSVAGRAQWNNCSKSILCLTELGCHWNLFRQTHQTPWQKDWNLFCHKLTACPIKHGGWIADSIPVGPGCAFFIFPSGFCFGQCHLRYTGLAKPEKNHHSLSSSKFIEILMPAYNHGPWPT